MFDICISLIFSQLRRISYNFLHTKSAVFFPMHKAWILSGFAFYLLSANQPCFQNITFPSEFAILLARLLKRISFFYKLKNTTDKNIKMLKILGPCGTPLIIFCHSLQCDDILTFFVRRCAQRSNRRLSPEQWPSGQGVRLTIWRSGFEPRLGQNSLLN